MSSGDPIAHDANDGEASSPLSFIANAMRSSAGKNWSTSNTPSLRIGGEGIIPTNATRSSGRPSLQEWWMRFDSRMCSRLASGSAAMPTSPSSPVT